MISRLLTASYTSCPEKYNEDEIKVFNDRVIKRLLKDPWFLDLLIKNGWVCHKHEFDELLKLSEV